MQKLESDPTWVKKRDERDKLHAERIRRSAEPKNGTETSPELVELRDYLVDQAAKIGDASGKNLDFSTRSVKHVETILAEIHRDYKRSQDDSGLKGVAIEFGAYLIKVIESNFVAGIWERDHPEMGNGTLPYYWQDQTLYPCMWCEKRIFDGPAENVWSKFKVLVLTRSD